MPNIQAVLREEIARLSRREVRSKLDAMKKASAQYRRHIAALKREVEKLARQVARLEKRAGVPKAAEAEAGEGGGGRVRFVAKGLRTRRERLGLSAEQYGRLVGVSGQTIYNWEHGHAQPRAAQRVALASIRSLGKRAALARLNGDGPGDDKPAPRRARKRVGKATRPRTGSAVRTRARKAARRGRPASGQAEA